MRSAVARLVGEPERFLDGVFGVAPLHLAGADDAGFADVLRLDDVDTIVAASGLRAPAFRLVKAGATLPTSRVTRRVRIGSRPVDDLVDVAAVHAEFADGATIVLQGLHRSWPPVAELCRTLEAELTHPVQANAYLTPPVAQGLDLHEDAHDVFALQTHGVKRWVVHPPTGGAPWDLTLHPGDVLYLPAGTRHAAQTVEEASLHLTLGVRTVDWADALQRVVEEVVARHRPPGPLPAGWADHPGAHAATLAGHLEELAAGLRSVDAADAEHALGGLAEAFFDGRAPDHRGGLRDLLEVGSIDDDTPLRRRQGAVARLGVADDGRPELRLTDRRLRFPTGLDDALRGALESPSLRPGELASHLDAPGRLVLCRRLVREGLFTIDRGIGDAGE